MTARNIYLFACVLRSAVSVSVSVFVFKGQSVRFQTSLPPISAHSRSPRTLCRRLSRHQTPYSLALPRCLRRHGYSLHSYACKVQIVSTSKAFSAPASSTHLQLPSHLRESVHLPNRIEPVPATHSASSLKYSLSHHHFLATDHQCSFHSGYAGPLLYAQSHRYHH